MLKIKQNHGPLLIFEKRKKNYWIGPKNARIQHNKAPPLITKHIKYSHIKKIRYQRYC